MFPFLGRKGSARESSTRARGLFGNREESMYRRSRAGRLSARLFKSGALSPMTVMFGFSGGKGLMVVVQSHPESPGYYPTPERRAPMGSIIFPSFAGSRWTCAPWSVDRFSLRPARDITVLSAIPIARIAGRVDGD